MIVVSAYTYFTLIYISRIFEMAPSVVTVNKNYRAQ